jgi:hypothetical protein
MILLLHYVQKSEHFIPAAVCGCTWPSAVCTYRPYCILYMSQPFFCSPYILSSLQSVSLHDLLQSAPIGPIAVWTCHNPSSAVRTYYPACSLCLYMTFCSLFMSHFLLLQAVHIIPTAVCVCTWPSAVWAYWPYCSLYMSQPFFCCMYSTSLLQSVSVYDLLQSVPIGPIAVCTCYNHSSAVRTYCCSLYILLQSVSVHKKWPSAVRTYYPYGRVVSVHDPSFESSTVYILSLRQSASVHDLLQSVHIIHNAVCVCTWSFFYIMYKKIIHTAVCVCTWSFFCSLYKIVYLLSLLQSVSVHDVLQSVHIIHNAVCVCTVCVCTWPSAVCT